MPVAATADPVLLRLQGGAELLIALSCLAMLGALLHFVRTTRPRLAPFWAVGALALFLAASALANLATFVGLWEPLSRGSVSVTVVASLAAVAAAVTLLRVLPKARAFMAAARLSDERRLELEALRAVLERQVEEGTRDLAQASDTARRAEARFHHVVESAPSAIVIMDSERRILFVNRGAEALFGYDRHALLDQQIDVLVPERYRAAHVGYVAEFFGEPRARPMAEDRALFGRRRDGQDVPIEIALTPIETADGLCTLASIIAISARVRAGPRGHPRRSGPDEPGHRQPGRQCARRHAAGRHPLVRDLQSRCWTRPRRARCSSRRATTCGCACRTPVSGWTRR
ncbi:PAS domain S-box protein [Luteitalea sp.]|uniref:PAS domain S-box protein n=1 Tax=Luteitalea sp. TaxID=2004800 RepID=UPI0025C39D38|nr:PAS domain S-box protein [Luteitalea sp.]